MEALSITEKKKVVHHRQHGGSKRASMWLCISRKSLHMLRHDHPQVGLVT